ncbi:MAG: hypothetical protein INQ03_05260 [Candidatus Heimdallarchaeota archaeon]|nr:hypothetical protein [Candidatus Heimdallarchaeota archaeon]
MILDTFKIKNVGNPELQESVQDILKQHGYFSDLNSTSSDSFEFTVGANTSKTRVIMERNRHNPYLLTLKVDFGAIESEKIMGDHIRSLDKRRSTQRSSFSFIWIFLIIMWVGSYILGFLDFLFPSTLAKISFFGLLILLTLLRYLLAPTLTNMRRKNLLAFDSQVFLILKNELEMSEITDTQKQKCWNCFKERSITDTFCPFCGK